MDETDGDTDATSNERAGTTAPERGPTEEDRRSKIHRLIIVIVGAGFAAAAFSLLSGQATTVALAMKATVETDGAAFDTQTTATESDGISQVGIVTHFQDRNYNTAYHATIGGESYAGGTGDSTDYRRVDDTTYTRSSADGEEGSPGPWQPVADPDALVLPSGDLPGVNLPPAMIGWRGEGLTQLTSAAGPFETLGANRHRGVMSMGELRSMGLIPPPLVAVAEFPDLDDDAEVEVIFDVVDGLATQLFVQTEEAERSIMVVVRFGPQPDPSLLVVPPTS